MRIAISSKKFSGHTGSSRIISALSREFTARGHSVDIVGNTLRRAAVTACGARPVELVKNFFAKKLSREAYLEKHKRYMEKAVYALRIGNGDEAEQDILLLHNCVNLYSELVQGVSAGDSAAGGVSAIHRKILKNRLFGKMVANSELMKSDIIRRYGVDPRMITVIYPAYDRAVFSPDGRHYAQRIFRNESGIRDDAEFVVGMVTSGDFAKRNIKGFFESIRRLPDALAAKIHLVVVGKDRVEDYIADPPKNLVHIPLTANPAAVMRSLDVMLYPALLEEFGMVVTEAMACGTPVLTSRMVGASELFTGLHSEALCDRPDADYFASRLSRFLSDAAYREAMSAEAALMFRDLSWDTFFTAFSEIVSEVKGFHLGREQQVLNTLARIEQSVGYIFAEQEANRDVM